MIGSMPRYANPVVGYARTPQETLAKTPHTSTKEATRSSRSLNTYPTFPLRIKIKLPAHAKSGGESPPVTGHKSQMNQA
jgi:hypothetical protein